MLSKSNFVWRGMGALLGILGLAVVVAAGAADDLEGLRVRAEGRWVALIAGDFDKAYEFETPAYRQLYNTRQYRARYGNGLRWQRAKVVGMEPKSPGVVTVTLEIDYSFHVSGQGMMDNKGLVTETWLWVDDQWWHQSQ
ncbi:MAG: hypothetical protein RKO66_12240 [Candidatus Contendobacter sp.]|nr:hypothetical protein [Candidatus Contendobacter sp.]